MSSLRTFWTRWGQYWLPVILWMALIFLASSQTKNQMPAHPDGSIDWLLKKTAHLGVYAVLALWVWRAVGRISRPGRGWPGWAVLLICLAYAASDEFHQSFVPGRASALQDVGIDLLGVGLALGIGSWVLAQRARHPLTFRRWLWLDQLLDDFRPFRLRPQQDAAE